MINWNFISTITNAEPEIREILLIKHLIHDEKFIDRLNKQIKQQQSERDRAFSEMNLLLSKADIIKQEPKSDDGSWTKDVEDFYAKYGHIVQHNFK